MAVSDTTSTVDNYYIGKGVLWWKKLGETTWRMLGNAPTFELTPTLDKIQHYSSMAGVRTLDLEIVRLKSLAVRMVLEEITAKNLALAMMADPDAAVTLTTTADTNTGTGTDGATLLENISSTSGLVAGRTYDISGTGTGGEISASERMLYLGGGSGTLELGAATAGTAVDVSITSPIAMTILSESLIKGALRFEGTNDYGARSRFEIQNLSVTPSGSVAVIGEDIGNLTLEGNALLDTYGNLGYAYWNIG